jgi:hypothetical protein
MTIFETERYGVISMLTRRGRSAIAARLAQKHWQLGDVGRSAAYERGCKIDLPMVPFTYRCPRTGLQVQGWAAARLANDLLAE